jgi:multiple sugar transport system ATP-binding protein
VLQQVGTPEEVYASPANIFVAQFVGSPVMNMFPTRVREKAGGMQVDHAESNMSFRFPAALSNQLSKAGANVDALVLGVRPEGVQVSREAGEDFVELKAGIIEPLGSHDIVDLEVGEGMLRARTKSGYVPGPGEKVWVRIDPAQAHFFDTTTGHSLGVSL